MRIFVAHPFTNLPLADYRDAFNAVAVRLNARDDTNVSFEFAEGARQADAQHILDEIEELIDACDAVIADLTTLNPNVMFECGIAKGSSKPTTFLLKTSAEPPAIPSDLQGFQRRQYSDRRGLEAELEGIVRRYVDGQEDDRAEMIRNHIEWATEFFFDILDEAEEPLRISEISEMTGVDQALARELLKPLLDDDRAYREGEGSGTRYATYAKNEE